MNNVFLIGRLTKDPELKYTPNGVAVTQFTLACDRQFNSSNGEKEVDFIPIVAWRQLAENCANHLGKGRLVAVTGRIQVRNYENEEGKRVYVTEIISDNVKFLDYAKDYKVDNKNEKYNPEPYPKKQDDLDPFKSEGRPADINEEDLPF